MSNEGASSLFNEESMPEDKMEVRQRRVRTTQMGEPVPRRVERKQTKPAAEWMKAIIMSIAALAGFVVFTLRKKATYLARKGSDFKTFDKCNLATYPVWKLDEAEELNMSKCEHMNLPDDIEVWSRFKSLKKLDLNSNSLTDLPSAMEALAPSLEILFLSENKFTKVPDVIKKMTKLRVLSMRGNLLTELTSENLPVASLVWLILTNNNIGNISSNVNNLTHLRKLMLSHNSLHEIPLELHECKDLELIRLADNNLETIPREVLSLPRLGWISLSGNPIFKSKTPKNSEKIIKENDIEINKSKILGQGASGIVFSGTYQDQDVAVKVFKEQSKGSDGNAEDEMSINSVVDNPYAISAIGVVENNGKKEMLVMKLLKGTSPLGKVPSFDTVTRDAGPAPLSQKIINKEVLLTTIWNVASALEYIHGSIGVSHGDIYLHNVLIDGDKVSRISDWGASFAYDLDDAEQAELIEKIEVLAFGRLIQDILSWHSKVIEGEPFKGLLDDILQPEITERPGFKAIKDRLALMPEMSEIAG
jgi:Leucine-rich repeat (LRR) protein